MEMAGVINSSGDLPFSTDRRTVLGLAAHTLDNATDNTSVSTGPGLAPKYLGDVIARRLAIEVEACSPVVHDLLPTS